MLDMDFEEETFDIIWSEGALYFMGFQNGLKRCHQLLKDKGYLAVTELVYTVPDPPAPVVEYLESEYPDIKNIEDNIDVIKKEGFNLISNFTLPESAWLNNYYPDVHGRNIEGFGFIWDNLILIILILVIVWCFYNKIN